MKTAVLALAVSVLPIIALAQEAGGDRPDASHHEKAERHSKDAHRADLDERMARMKREVGELQRAGRADEAERVMKELHAMAAQRERMRDHSTEPKKRPASEGPERARHVQEAIRHLRAAGLDEPARDLEHIAAKLREEAERNARADSGHHEGSAGPAREMHRELQEVREQLRRVSQELQELRQNLRREKAGAGQH